MLSGTTAEIEFENHCEYDRHCRPDGRNPAGVVEYGAAHAGKYLWNNRYFTFRNNDRVCTSVLIMENYDTEKMEKL
jgi:hypothetical protein